MPQRSVATRGFHRDRRSRFTFTVGMGKLKLIPEVLFSARALDTQHPEGLQTGPNSSLTLTLLTCFSCHVACTCHDMHDKKSMPSCRV